MCAIVQDWLYRLCACRGACMDTLTIVLYSLGQWSEYAGHPDESLARKVFTDGQLQDVSPG